MDVLRGYGYYDATIQTRSIRKENGKYKLIISVNKGSPYLLEKFNLMTISDSCYDLKQVSLKDLEVYLKSPVNSKKLVQAQEKLQNLLSQNGHPLAFIETPQITVDQAQKTASVDLKVDCGPKTYFGKTQIEKGKGVKEKFILNRIFYKEGDLFNSDLVAKTEKALYDSGLFSVVNITPDEKLDTDNKLPLTIELTDSKFNALTLGGTYTTTWGGIGGNATWQNRNLFHTGTDLKLNLSINRRMVDAGLEFMIPDFFSPVQTLALTSNAINDEQPNFTEKAIKTDLFVERELNQYFKATVGTKFDQLRTLKSDNDGYFSLFGLLANIGYQSSNMVLINPRQGAWFTVQFNPYFSMKKNEGSFAEVKFEGSVYQYLIPSKRLVLAMNVVLGSLFGESNFDIPPPYRYYAGSPDHLRGYPYQSVSPLNNQLKVIGGRSVFLWSIEPRFMVFKSFEVVGFFDVGNVYRGEFPNFSDQLVKSLGFGVRYFSFVGPLRLDIGFPLDKLLNLEADPKKRKYEIYFSIGQAF